MGGAKVSMGKQELNTKFWLEDRMGGDMQINSKIILNRDYINEF
jgi:hypothetical protein